MGFSKARILVWVAISLLQGIFPTQGSNLRLLHCRRASLAPPRKPTHHYIEKRYTARTYYIAQGILLNILSETNMGQEPEKKYMYMNH